MYKIKETIIVEGVYDKIKLSRFIDAVIVVINGFSIYKNAQMLNFIKKMAVQTGIIIFTDSDKAGFRIRSFIKQSVTEGRVLHAYIPDVRGKEKRKTSPGKEGLLGVEGIKDDILLNALIKSGCSFESAEDGVPDSGSFLSRPAAPSITKAELMRHGLSGGKNSAAKRVLLCREMNLPENISANMLLDVLNRLITPQELGEIVQNIQENL